jgi:RimJ/RimL family protein N-acetyltransferase
MSEHLSRVGAAPAIETERLRLRAHRVHDFADCVAMWGDPRVTRHIGGWPFSAVEVWARMLRYAGLWSLLGFGYWAVEERGSGRFVGEVGFADFKREIEPSIDGQPEIGWVLAPWAQGRGLATEAVGAALAWGDHNWGGRPTVCLIDPANAASIRLAGKCGYRELARTTYKGGPTILFRR